MSEEVQLNDVLLSCDRCDRLRKDCNYEGRVPCTECAASGDTCDAGLRKRMSHEMHTTEVVERLRREVKMWKEEQAKAATRLNRLSKRFTKYYNYYYAEVARSEALRKDYHAEVARSEALRKDLKAFISVVDESLGKQ
ncbi:hypothetical protein CYLTODRAFT_495593 [Cylindrobasidium torrendii FP15055 ss-10]|uniref:Zn(2)-C6 fungal-type domain-containing protein n=1 Tax=Cylindrobasidium torrendii FP15055 ss-10 TaxID=1314674 RepID=A0A0D7ATA7_9AGAR|nr:hypothetical protein CYLTODRAFT_495593 [Cylindrobasidium torrendii FP15055 ss-10]